MKKFYLFSATVCALMLSSCATLFCGTKATVTFDSNVDKSATLVIDGRKHKNVEFPYTTKVERGFDTTIVKGQMEGYSTQTIYVDKKLNWVSVLNLTDVLGWGIDVLSGAVMAPEYDYYEFEFEKVSETKAEVTEQSAE